MSTTKLHRDKARVANAWNPKEKYIIISAFKIYVPTILGELNEGKESTTPLTEIRTPELWNAYDNTYKIKY